MMTYEDEVGVNLLFPSLNHLVAICLNHPRSIRPCLCLFILCVYFVSLIIHILDGCQESANKQYGARTPKEN